MDLIALPAKILGVILLFILIVAAGALFFMMGISLKRKNDPDIHLTPQDAIDREQAEKESPVPKS